MQDVQVYLENRPQIVIPLPIIEAANNKGEPRDVFNKIKIKDIISFMEQPFKSKDLGNPNPRDPNLLIEKFNG